MATKVNRVYAESELPNFCFLVLRASVEERGILARHFSIQALTASIWVASSCMWEAALKQLFTHFPFRCHRQHMLGIGAEPAWSMKTCHASLLFVSKTPFWGLTVASTALEARVAVRVAVPEDAAAAVGAAGPRLPTLSRKNSLSLYENAPSSSC